MIKKFDLFVIGGGSAGVAHARRAAEYGAKVAVAEYGPLGGTCVNVGCVPKKVMWYAASLAHQFEHAADYGFNVSVEGHDWSAVKSRRDAYVKRLNDIYEKLLDGSDVDYLADAARFVDAHTVAVGDEEYSAERIVIATGGRPIVPDVPGAALGITSDDFFELDERPERVLVVGSGYVAVELAGVFRGLGSDTQVLVRKQGVVRNFDAMLGTELLRAMRDAGIPVAAAGMSVRCVNLRDNLHDGSFPEVIWEKIPA